MRSDEVVFQSSPGAFSCVLWTVFMLLIVAVFCSCGEDKGVADQLLAAKRFVGDWTNEDDQTRGITRIGVRLDSDTLYLHMWASCGPGECDWGENRTPATDADDGSLSLVWDQVFAIDTQTLELMEDSSRLKVMTHIHYVDDSGRLDSDHTEYFRPD